MVKYRQQNSFQSVSFCSSRSAKENENSVVVINCFAFKNFFCVFASEKCSYNFSLISWYAKVKYVCMKTLLNHKSLDILEFSSLLSSANSVFFFSLICFFFSEVEQNSWSMDGYVSYLTKLGWVIILLVPLKCSKVVRKTEFFMKTNEIENVVGGELKREETLWRIPPNQIFRLTKAKQDNYLFNTVHNLLNK